jgi:hypothetical protein
MTPEVMQRNHARRNRMIAIAAGVITVIAVVLGFAGDFLGLPWHWMRPAAELLLLAELVGLVVLERHQLFEPVQEDVSAIKRRVDVIDTTLSTVAEQLGSSSRLAICANTPEVLRALARICRAALARDYAGPQILRVAGLSGQVIALDSREAAAEVEDLLAAFAGYCILPSSAPDSRARRWSVRALVGAATAEGLEATIKIFAPTFEQGVLNFELKMFTRSNVESILSPQTITDREAVLAFDDASAALRWGVTFEDRHCAALLGRWFDDLWASVPQTNLIYSRTGLNQAAIDRFRRELAANNGASKSEPPERPTV